jgi:hypothetical protein
MTGMWVTPGNILAVFLTLAIFSFLFRDNPIYKVAEHLFVGVAAGYFIVIEYHTVFLPNLWYPLTHDVRALFTAAAPIRAMAGQLTLIELSSLSLPNLPLSFSSEVRSLLGAIRYSNWNLALVIPFALGLLMFTQLVKKYAWLSRWPMAVVIGSFSGLALLGNAQGDLIPQIKANMIPFLKPGAWSAFVSAPGLFSFLDVLWNPILIVGVICVLFYFFFSTPHEGAVGVLAAAGMGFLMISFGAAYGNTVMTRISLLIERFDFMLKPGTRAITGVLLASFVGYFLIWSLRQRRTTPADPPRK